MGYVIGAVVALLVVAGAAWLMLRSFRSRQERDAVLTAHPMPATLGAPSLECEALYVATTPAGEPLERLAMPGLAFRGSARVEVVPEGVVLRIAGEPASFVPADKLVGAAPATWVIDRSVEPEGLVSITWIAAEEEPGEHPAVVDSYLRARYAGDSAAIIATITDIATAVLPQAPTDDAADVQPTDHAADAQPTDIAADDAPRPALQESEASDD
ncbi:hypothetical protein ACDF64_15330 [Agromyces sp. MMS24-JH15]|uniref:PH-like domain-containing protein n=1 Tax=Agromyces sp. MMS24-JH15 TaxID=3243765 RepID=UPI0037482388